MLYIYESWHPSWLPSLFNLPHQKKGKCTKTEPVSKILQPGGFSSATTTLRLDFPLHYYLKNPVSIAPHNVVKILAASFPLQKNFLFPPIQRGGSGWPIVRESFHPYNHFYHHLFWWRSQGHQRLTAKSRRQVVSSLYTQWLQVNWCITTTRTNAYLNRPLNWQWCGPQVGETSGRPCGLAQSLRNLIGGWWF